MINGIILADKACFFQGNRATILAVLYGNPAEPDSILIEYWADNEKINAFVTIDEIEIIEEFDIEVIQDVEKANGI